MKIYSPVIAFIILLLGTTNGKAQVEITPMGGYVFKASFNVDDGKAMIQETPAFGINVLIALKYSEIYPDFTYERQDTKLFIDATDSLGMPYKDTISIGVNYLSVGAVYENYNEKSKFTPYAGMNVGINILSDQDNSDHLNSFSFGLKGGVKYFPTKHIGFRLQPELNMAIFADNSSFGAYVTTSGSGFGFAISSVTSMGQFGIMGGIIFKL